MFSTWEQTGHLGGLNTKMRRRLAGEDNVTPMCNSAIRTRLFFSCSFLFSPHALVWSLLAICVMPSWASRFQKSIHYRLQKQIPSNHQLINCISDMLHCKSEGISILPEATFFNLKKRVPSGSVQRLFRYSNQHSLFKNSIRQLSWQQGNRNSAGICTPSEEEEAARISSPRSTQARLCCCLILTAKNWGTLPAWQLNFLQQQNED